MNAVTTPAITASRRCLAAPSATLVRAGGEPCTHREKRALQTANDGSRPRVHTQLSLHGGWPLVLPACDEGIACLRFRRVAALPRLRPGGPLAAPLPMALLPPPPSPGVPPAPPVPPPPPVMGSPSSTATSGGANPTGCNRPTIGSWLWCPTTRLSQVQERSADRAELCKALKAFMEIVLRIDHMLRVEPAPGRGATWLNRQMASRLPPAGLRDRAATAAAARARRGPTGHRHARGVRRCGVDCAARRAAGVRDGQ